MTYFKHNAFTGEMYLSKHDTEFLGLPVGNAFSGAPFKQKNMPFFIAPAIAAVGTAVGVGATIAATAVAIGTVAAVAGTAMTVVGAITGDKGLMKIGAIVGLAGAGVGMIAGGAAAAASGGSFLSGMGGMGSAGIASSQAAAASEVAASGALGINAAINSTPTAMAQASAAANSSPIISGATQSSSVLGTSLSTGAQTAVAPLMTPINATSTFNAATGAVTVGANAPASAGFFSEMLSGMTPTEKLMTASFGLKAVGGIGDAYNTNQKNKYDQKAEAQRLTNLNAQPTISGLFGYDAKGNKVTSPAQSAQPTASTTSLAPPTLAVPTLTPSGLLAQGVK